MLARWLDRGGLGQVVAPDEKIAKEPIPDEASSFFWQLVAPDPNFQRESEPLQKAKAPPPAAFLPPIGTNCVQCIHCKNYTPVSANLAQTNARTLSRLEPEGQKENEEKSSGASTSNVTSTAILRTPTRPWTSRMEEPELENLVLSAAKDTAMSMTSPTHDRDERDRVFRLSASTKPLKDALLARLRKLLQKDPSLIYARSTHLGTLVPDGYTPIMAAAHANHVAAAEVILELSPHAHLERDLQGRTPLHIASELGHLDMINLLKPKYQSKGFTSPPPVDLLGRTPLGRAVTSPNPVARRRQKELEEALFSPGDVSVCGRPKPGQERTGMDSNLQIAYGVADMPGFRVTMEDAVFSSMWHRDDQTYCAIGVCDGHGDRGIVSKFIADNVDSYLQSNMVTHGTHDWNAIWKNTCKAIDSDIKSNGYAGGSTAVMALITAEAIVVANVGDSRCILIQSPQKTSLQTKMEQLSIAEQKPSDVDNEPAQIEENNGADAGETQTAENEGAQETPKEESAKEESSKEEISKEEESAQEESSKEEISKEESPSTTEVKEENIRTIAAPPQQVGPVVIPLSEDHKPDLELERARIENAGMKVVPITFEENGKDVTIYKVQRTDKGQMAVSRAFGDFEYKSNINVGEDEQAVVSVPDVKIHSRDPDADLYMVLACDGVWDVMTNEDVAKFVVPQIEARTDMSEAVLPEVGDALLNECLSRGSRDNMTVAIVALSKAADAISAGPMIQGKTLDFS